MTNTEFQRIKKAVEKNGWFRLYDSKSNYTEIIKWGPGEYGVYSVCHVGSGGVVERNCITTDYSLDGLKYLFVE